MLAREARLRKNKDFDFVYKKGICYSSRFLLLFVLKNKLPSQRCGFSISKKISKKATDRNKLKRHLSHIYGEETSKLDKSIDLIFVARKNILDLDFLTLKSTVGGLLRKANLYKQEEIKVE